ncbi:hypothetical protein EYF80_028271 [Liparis tanakae]|uniref:Uncharacterized protein n=1 Tax=Liparis tanakae TaxID=230148 RepID=A0A4Z2H6Z5_9TELE|nr:hypothetical protein EYF80_028271 [Liparis tanakae]
MSSVHLVPGRALDPPSDPPCEDTDAVFTCAVRLLEAVLLAGKRRRTGFAGTPSDERLNLERDSRDSAAPNRGQRLLRTRA